AGWGKGGPLYFLDRAKGVPRMSLCMPCTAVSRCAAKKMRGSCALPSVVKLSSGFTRGTAVARKLLTGENGGDMNSESPIVVPTVEKVQAHVLVVDADPELLTTMAQLLSAEGYLVATAATAEDALDRFRSETFHLVLTDLQLPGK